MGKVVRALEKSGEPILLEQRHRPVGVIISLKDFEERFVVKAATEARLKLFAQIDEMAIVSQDKKPAEAILRDLRRGDS